MSGFENNIDIFGDQHKAEMAEQAEAEEIREETREAEHAPEEERTCGTECDEREAEAAEERGHAEAGNTEAEADEEKNDEGAGTEQEETAEAETAEHAGTEEAEDGEAESAEDPEAEAEAAEAKPEKHSFFKKKKDKKDEKIEELTDQLKRQMAEFDNFRKRTEKEKASMFDMGVRSAVEKILPIVDNFERGLNVRKEEERTPFSDGMEMVYKQLQTVLEGMDVKPIEAVGQPFDPNFHNAIMQDTESDAPDNTVVEEFQKGYTYKGTVIRYSMVKVKA